MIRSYFLAAALAAGLAGPAFAADEAGGPAMQNLFTSTQAREHLSHLGYTNISALEKDADGKWIGTATKDGRTVAVAVDVKGQLPRN